MFWERIKDKSSAQFKRLSRVHKETFYLMVRPFYNQNVKVVRKKSNYHSHPFSLLVEDQTLLTLMYYRDTIPGFMSVAPRANVDILLKDWSGNVPNNLIVRTQGSFANKQKFYLAILFVKGITQGGYLNNKKDISFYEKCGSKPLPQNTQAFVFTIGKEPENFYYSPANFITTIN